MLYKNIKKSLTTKKQTMSTRNAKRAPKNECLVCIYIHFAKEQTKQKKSGTPDSNSDLFTCKTCLLTASPNSSWNSMCSKFGHIKLLMHCGNYYSYTPKQVLHPAAVYVLCKIVGVHSFSNIHYAKPMKWRRMNWVTKLIWL